MISFNNVEDYFVLYIINKKGRLSDALYLSAGDYNRFEIMKDYYYIYLKEEDRNYIIDTKNCKFVRLKQ